MKAMVKSLKTLISLAEKDVEAEQKALALLQEKWDLINSQKTDLENQVAKEAELAKQSPEMAADFGNFVGVASDKIQKLAQSLQIQEEKIAIQRDILREKFAEQKKYEIALENKEQAIFEEEKRKEQNMLDDIAIQGHLRKSD